MNLSTFPRRILLAVTGLSPQIVTETVHALAVAQHPAWIPTEIRLVTTARGAENARLNLLSERPGWFRRLVADYGLPEIAFPPENIHVIQRDGQPLEDIRDDEDNRLAADFVAETVRALTADADSAIHASIAGGRKTMGFYLGYAMSLFGRPQDRLSHVLVSAPFESHRDFFYPTPYEHIIHPTDKAQDVQDCRNARIWLGDIPFVRLREGLPKQLLEGRARFSEAVAEAQKALPPLSLRLDPATRTVMAGGEAVQLKPAEFAFYWMLAERRFREQPGVHWSERNLEAELGAYYAQMVKPHSGDFVHFEETGMSKDNFNARKAHINKALRMALGERRAEPYVIQTLHPLPGKGRCHPYGLTLPPETIAILPASLQGRQGSGAGMDNGSRRST